MGDTKPFPIPTTDLDRIVRDSCTTVLASATGYSQSDVAGWNSTLVDTILRGIIAAMPQPASPQYKYAVNSTIIQHLDSSAGTQTASPPGTPDGGVGGTSAATKGRRGMHSATGAYWNGETDGMWSCKWDGGEAKGMDVVVSVIWMAV